jgi:hypothetical protein
MAIVPDLSGNFPASLPLGTEGSFSSVNRIVAAPPNSATTPLYSGEVVRDSSTQLLWRALGTTNTSWVNAIIQA